LGNYKDIDNTHYIINRVFSQNKTTAMLITERVLEEKSSISELTGGRNILYNTIGGSIQSKEAL